MGTINITQGGDRLGKVPKKDFFPVRKVPKRKTRTWQTRVQSSERGRTPIYCTSRFSIERAERPGTVCIRAAVLPPFPCRAWLRSAFFHSRAPVRGVPACASAVPGHAVSRFSTASLAHVFAPTSSAGPRSSGKRSIGAKIMPTFSRVLSRDSPTQLSKKKWNDYLTFFLFVLLTSISQYISETILFV